MTNEKRPAWDAYFLRIARAVSERADCTRAKHGAVLVQDRRIVSTGYNGAPSGAKGCASANACPRGRMSGEDLGHLAGGYDDPKSAAYCIAIHAEVNALLYGNRTDYEGGTLYITGEPCHGCRKVARGAGIRRLVWSDLQGWTRDELL